MASVGRIEPYDGNCDLERLELYFIANNVGAISGDDNEAARRLADRKKVVTLLPVVGSETYLLFWKVCWVHNCRPNSRSMK